jgi:hypothetical protein
VYVARRATATKAAEPAVLASTEAGKALLCALADPAARPLNGTTSKPGFFTGTSQAVKDAAKLCVERGWLEPTGETAGTGRSAQPLYRLTDAGRREALGRIGQAGVAELRAQLEQLQRTLQTVQSAIDPLLDALGSGPGTQPPATQASAPLPNAPAQVPLTSERLRIVLKQKYDYLRQLVEFEDGLVALPRLYEKASGELPGLTVPAFHAELLKLWDERVIELHVLNEVRSAKNPELGIRRNDALYYFAYWKDRQ